MWGSEGPGFTALPVAARSPLLSSPLLWRQGVCARAHRTGWYLALPLLDSRRRTDHCFCATEPRVPFLASSRSFLFSLRPCLAPFTHCPSGRLTHQVLVPSWSPWIQIKGMCTARPIRAEERIIDTATVSSRTWVTSGSLPPHQRLQLLLGYAEVAQTLGNVQLGLALW